MKLLLTLDFPPERGGIQKYLFEKAVHTFSADDRIVVGAQRRSTEKADGLPCTVTRLANDFSRFNKKWSVINLVIYLLGALRKGSVPAVIECGNVYAGIAPWTISLFRPVRYHVYIYGTELLCLQKRSLRSLLLKSVLKRARALIAIGTFSRDLVRNAGIENECVIDPPRITLPVTSHENERRGDGAETIRLLSVGRLVSSKGHGVLCAACAALPAALPWRLVIAGSGPEEKQLSLLVDELKLTGRVLFKKGLDDAALMAEFRNAGLFILPSVAVADGIEGFGIVLLEAMAAGTPIIASNVGGIPEVLDNGECGLLVEPGNAMALRDAIANLSNNSVERERLSSNALNRVRDNYAW
jgi:glycosyltransferase involved in cell wall biosynthesis